MATAITDRVAAKRLVISCVQARQHQRLAALGCVAAVTDI